MSDPIARLTELDEQETATQLKRIALLSLMDAVVDALPDALVVSDLAGTIAFFNTSAELMFGYHRSSVIGEKVEMLMPDTHRARHVHDREVYGRFATNVRSKTMGIGMDLTGVHSDGHAFPVDITLARVVTREGVFLLAQLRFAQSAASEAPDAGN